MLIRTRLILVAPTWLLAACPGWPAYEGCVDACLDWASTTTTTTGETPTPTTAIQTVTGEPPDEPGASATTTTSGPGGETTSGLDEPPQIVEVELDPIAITINGLIDVSVSAEHVDGVHMTLSTGDLIELTPAQPGGFHGAIEGFTGLDNGMHTATLTPWRGDLEGAAVEADYAIALPMPGSQSFWETGDLIGSGHVAAMGVLPDGRIVDLGTYYPMGEPRCYLRARDRHGVWFADDFVPLLPTAHCNATDLTVDPDTGALHVLVNRKTDEGLRWWVGEIPTFGKGLTNIGIGALGDNALALARHPNMIAVCGSKQVPTNDLDAFAVLLRPNQPGDEHLFDYKPPANPDKHRFSETMRDCTFAGDTLVLVGEAWGKHKPQDLKEPERDRLALIEYDVITDKTHWTVAGPGPGVQSRALAVAVDDEGRYLLAGYTCLDDCKQEGELRIYEPGGKLDWQAPLGLLGSDAFGPHDIAWSPAGYAVIAMGEPQDQSYVFKVQAFAPHVYKPLWTFTPNDKQGLQIAYALAIGAFGEIYAGGISEGSYPAVAYIAG